MQAVFNAATHVRMIDDPTLEVELGASRIASREYADNDPSTVPREP